MVFKNGVNNIQAAAYSGALTVNSHSVLSYSTNIFVIYRGKSYANKQTSRSDNKYILHLFCPNPNLSAVVIIAFTWRLTDTTGVSVLSVYNFC